MKAFNQSVYRVGERRKLDFKVIPRPGSIAAVITDARAEIVGSETVPTCEVSGNVVSVYFDALAVGMYELRVYITVPPEVIECEKMIKVV